MRSVLTDNHPEENCRGASPVRSTDGGARLRWWSDVERKCLFGLVAFFLAFRVFDAPIRYVLAKAGVSSLSSLPNLLILAFLSLYLLKIVSTRSAERYVFWSALFFIYSLIVGCIFIGNPKQVAMGLYALFPFFLGLVSHRVFTEHFPSMKSFFVCCWIFCVLGIFLSLTVSLPWVGLTYESFGMEVEGTREWTTFGIARVAGFSRSSFEAALTVLLFMAMLMSLLKRTWIKVALGAVSGAAIAVTTTKTIVVVYLLLVLYLLTSEWRRLWRAAAVLLATVMTVLPLTTCLVRYELNITDFVLRILFLSFEDRLINTWPNALRLLSERGSLLLGRGIGGIGGAQQYFEKAAPNPADNLFLYLYVTFGIASLPVLYVFLKRTVALATAEHTVLNRFFFLLSLAVLAFGITANVVEAPLFGFLLGVFLMYRQKVCGCGR